MELIKLAWAFRSLGHKLSFSRFGSASYMGKPVYVSGRRNIEIGNRVRIYPGSRMEAIGEGRIVICDDTSIGQNLHMTAEKETLVIGAHTTISANVFITNLDHAYQRLNQHVMSQERVVTTTAIGENCFIGYSAVILAGTVLGRQCVVGANSVVRGIFPDYCVIAGAPAKIIRKFNEQTGQWERAESC